MQLLNFHETEIWRGQFDIRRLRDLKCCLQYGTVDWVRSFEVWLCKMGTMKFVVIRLCNLLWCDERSLKEKNNLLESDKFIKDSDGQTSSDSNFGFDNIQEWWNFKPFWYFSSWNLRLHVSVGFNVPQNYLESGCKSRILLSETFSELYLSKRFVIRVLNRKRACNCFSLCFWLFFA